ncbi:9959_t:CDS:2, partial [Racocetra fulgida]
YNTLVHSPVPSIFDTLLQLEQSYNNAVKDLVTSHKIEMELEHVGIGPSQNGFSYMSERQTEDIEYSQATLESGLDELKKSQKQEYCDFVIKLYNAHQRWITEHQSTMDSNWMCRIDGKEIVSEVITDMKKHYKHLSNEILKLDQGSRPRSRHGSISSLTDEEDPSTMQMINDLTEMGFDDKQARIALDMTGGNKEHAAILLIEHLDKINAQIANGINGIPIIPRRPSTPSNNSSDHKELSGSLSLRRPKNRRPLTILTKLEKRNTWSPISFFQQKNGNTPNAPTKRFTGWLGRKDDANGNGPMMHSDNSQLGESFTITLGNQVKSTHNLRLLVADVDDLLKSSNDQLKEMAHRAQTAANLYSQDLAAIVLLLTPQDWPTYKFGKGANKESTEFHFDDVETQLEAIEKDFTNDRGVSSIEEERFDITNISLPFLLLPSNIDCFSDPLFEEKEGDLSKRGEIVLKCAKGFMMKNSRVPKHMTVKEQETKTVSFLLPKGASEQQFNSFRNLLTSIFRAN